MSSLIFFVYNPTLSHFIEYNDAKHIQHPNTQCDQHMKEQQQRYHTKGQQLKQREAEDDDHQYAHQATCARDPSSASNKDMCYISKLVIKELLR